MYQLAILIVCIFAAAGSVEERAMTAGDFQKGGFLNIRNGFKRPNNEVKIDQCKELAQCNITPNADGTIPACEQCDLFSFPSEHLCFIFNTFVLMQLFNWINCRKLNHEINVFSGIHKNITFCVIWVICLLIQVLLVEIRTIINATEPTGLNKAFGTHTLTLEMWGWCLLFGAGSLVVQFLISMFSKLFLKNWLAYDYTLNYTITENKDLEAAVSSPGDLRYFISGMSTKSNASHVSTGSRIVDNVVRTGRSQRASQHFAEIGTARRSGTITMSAEPTSESQQQQQGGGQPESKEPNKETSRNGGVDRGSVYSL